MFTLKQSTLKLIGLFLHEQQFVFNVKKKEILLQGDGNSNCSQYEILVSSFSLPHHYTVSVH